METVAVVLGGNRIRTSHDPLDGRTSYTIASIRCTGAGFFHHRTRMASVAEGLGTMAVLAGVAYYFATSTSGCGTARDFDMSNRRSTATIQVDRSAEGNQTRERLIAGFIANGVLSNVVMTGTTPDVATGPAWHRLSADDQRNVVSTVGAQYADLDNGFVRLQDGQNGKAIGTFSLQAGGLDLGGSNTR